MNVYNCTKPGNAFVGYDRLRSEITEDAIAGKSFAILGGRRCGKTSLLLQLQADLQRSNDANGSERKILVPFLDLQSLGQVTAAVLFRSLYEGTTRGVSVAAWPSCALGQEYETFLRCMDAAEPILNKAHGSDWLAVLLIDELDGAVGRLPDDQFFQNLRNLLMVSRYNDRFRVIASGVKEMARLISSGSSPLNNLCHVYLRVLSAMEVLTLVHKGLPNNIDEATLFNLTGRHPYLLQGVMEKVQRQSSQDSAAVQRAAMEWMREHKDFKRWYDGFEPSERRTYALLARQPSQQQSRGALLQELRTTGGELDEALTVLSFHGLIDDADPDRPQVAGMMFRDWFLEIHHEEGMANREALLGSWLGDARDQGRSAGGLGKEAKSGSNSDFSIRIPDHELIGETPIGAGSYGTVWLGKTLIGSYRAIKVIYRSSFDEDRPFEREFSGIKAYEPVSRTHPGLVQILQVGSNDAGGYFYYVMEAGDDERTGARIDPMVYSPKNLARVLREKGRMPLAECITLAKELAGALDHLHQHSLVHRDIKPSNIIFVKGVPKLADIGLVTGIRSKAGSGTWIGTQGYIPPEGPGTAVADIYSLGKVMYEAATGLDRERFPELPAAELPPNEQEAFAHYNEVVLRACHAEPKQRFESAAELQSALAELSGSQGSPRQRRTIWDWLRPRR